VTPLPAWLTSTLASDGAAGRGALPGWIQALSPEAVVVGPALVVAVAHNDNRAMRAVPDAVQGPGTVLVVSCGEESTTAILGEIIARELLGAGIVAVVTDGLIRDRRDVAAAGLPVWARGVTPVASAKEGPDQVGGSVTIGGVAVSDGDIVVADADGVVIWPAADVERFVAAADAKRRSDDERMARLTGAGGLG